MRQRAATEESAQDYSEKFHRSPQPHPVALVLSRHLSFPGAYLGYPVTKPSQYVPLGTISVIQGFPQGDNLCSSNNPGLSFFNLHSLKTMVGKE